MKALRCWLALSIALSWQGCGPGGTGTGNPAVTIISQAYAPSATALRIPGLDWLVPSATAAGSVSSFRFCVTKMKLKNEDGSTIQENGSDEIEAKLGLINLGDGSSSATWGELQFPKNAVIKKIEIEIHRDAELCNGATYSALINGKSLTKDLEFRFVFSSPQRLSQGETVTFALTNLVKALNQALTGGELDDEHISNYLDGSVEDSCH